MARGYHEIAVALLGPARHIPAGARTCRRAAASPADALSCDGRPPPQRGPGHIIVSREAARDALHRAPLRINRCRQRAINGRIKRRAPRRHIGRTPKHPVAVQDALKLRNIPRETDSCFARHRDGNSPLKAIKKKCADLLEIRPDMCHL